MDSRIDDLEIRFTHQEAAVEELTRQVRAQEKVIGELRAQIKHLHSQLKSLSSSNVAPLSEESPPPHY